MSEHKKPDKHSDVHDAAAKLGHLGGLKGGPARAAKLTDEERSKIASEGGKARAAKAHAVKKRAKKK